MRKQRCCECGRLRDMHEAVVRHADGTVDMVCRACWRELDMGEYILRAVLREGPRT